MYPCPFCHSQLTWVPQYNQYYCYFCHRYVPTSAPPPQQQYAQAHQQPAVQPYALPAQNVYVPQQQPAQQPAQAVSPMPVGASAEPAVATAHPVQAPTPKPAVEYAPKGSPPEPVSVPVSGQPAPGEPIYLCKTCGSRLEVSDQRWYCPRCQQYK